MKIYRCLHSLFIKHPTSAGETYFQHLMVATSFAVKMTLGGIACFLHGIFPFLFVKTGSTLIDELYHAMVLHRGENRDTDHT